MVKVIDLSAIYIQMRFYNLITRPINTCERPDHNTGDYVPYSFLQRPLLRSTRRCRKQGKRINSLRSSS